MLKSRVGYLLALGAALLFYVSYTKRLSGYLLLLTFLFPVFDAAVSLLGILRARLSLATNVSLVPRAQTLTVTLRADCALGGFLLPTPLIRAKLRSFNPLTGEETFSALWLRPGDGFAMSSRAFSPSHCGLIEYTLLGPRVYDLLGLFCLPMKSPKPVTALVIPTDRTSGFQQLPSPTAEEEGDAPLRRPGAFFGADVREYRAGDSLRAVHWKLTARLGKLLVREPEDETEEPRARLICDLSGSPDELDDALDHLAGFSRFLLNEGIPLALFWFDARREAMCSMTVDNENAFGLFLRERLSSSAPSNRDALLKCCMGMASSLGDVQSFYVSSEGVRLLSDALYAPKDTPPVGGVQ